MAIVLAELAGTYARSPSLALVFGGLIVLLFSATVLRFRRQARRFVADNAHGIAALARGDLSRARDIYWTWAENTKVPRIAATARHNLAWTLMRQGEHDQAIAVLTENDTRNYGALRAIGLFPTSAVDLALNYALLGNLEVAEKWLNESEQRGKELAVPSLSAMKAFTRAVIDCRAGRCVEAVRLLDDRWAEYEGVLTGETLRPLRVVRAFAIAAGGPREAGRAEAAVLSARPTYPEEYTFLGKAWPEMAAFLAANSL